MQYMKLKTERFIRDRRVEKYHKLFLVKALQKEPFEAPFFTIILLLYRRYHYKKYLSIKIKKSFHQSPRLNLLALHYHFQLCGDFRIELDVYSINPRVFYGFFEHYLFFVNCVAHLGELL